MPSEVLTLSLSRSSAGCEDIYAAVTLTRPDILHWGACDLEIESRIIYKCFLFRKMECNTLKDVLWCGYLCLSFAVLFQISHGKDTETSACYSNVNRCGQHTMSCPVGHTVVVTDALYAHQSRTTTCTRGKLSSCSDRYINACCKRTGRQCYKPYTGVDADRLLRSCLGSRSCDHMTPQKNQNCGQLKLPVSTFSVVSHRCVLDTLIIGYDVETQITNNLVYLLYRIPITKTKQGTANVYGCDVTGPEGANVKVRALDVSMVSVNGGPCSGLEIDKEGDVTIFSCERTDLRFLATLYDGAVPIAVNIVDVGGTPPQAAWVLLEGRGNITVDCGKIRETRKVPLSTSTTTGSSTLTSTQTTSASSTTQSTQSTTPTSGSSATSTTVASIPSSTPSPSTSQTSEPLPETKPEPDSTPEPSRTNSDTSPSSQAVTSAAVSNSVPETEEGATVVKSSGSNSAATYGGVATGLLLLILIIIVIVAVLCYRRRRYRRYQSRKVEEERNIPDGEERSWDKTDGDRERDDTSRGGPSPGQGHKGNNSSNNSPLKTPTSRSGGRQMGRKERALLASSDGGPNTSPPRVSQPRDSDGYTNAGKPYSSSDNPSGDFYDNPGFKTTVESLKIF
ncbi:mucin-5AC-like isoform X1 [Haliotis rufescens]|uniref:mucin-5AC-like isoform X1 n=1 Tax=Haliotis rufescens TaxID=6454 RepID=UPI001EB08F03|nr:mucin-5AC-like isoform X1 [Haliotis rufescens]